MCHLAPPLTPGSRAGLPTQVDKCTAEVSSPPSPIALLRVFSVLLDDAMTSLHAAGGIAVEAVFEGTRVSTRVVFQPEHRGHRGLRPDLEQSTSENT